MAKKEHRIGIGVINHNRNSVFDECYSNVVRFAPHDAKISVVDDASKEPIKNATVRHERQNGIAASKNANLRELQGCEHIFLLDSDCWPKHPGCWEAYINAGFNHLCLTWQKNVLGHGDARAVADLGSVTAYSHANGCMLYLNNTKVNGIRFDEGYGLWGFEHIAFSMSIHNVGHTPYPFMDIKGSLRYFHPLDFYSLTESSVPEPIRIAHAQRNRIKYEQQCKE